MAEQLGPTGIREVTQLPGIAVQAGKQRKRRGRLLLWIAAFFVLLILGLGIAAQIALNRAEPILRARVIDTLSTRFDSRVELDHFEVIVFRGFEVEGGGLRLYPRRFLTDQPLIAITKFRFRTSWLSLLRTPMHVGQVSVDGMAINMPPKELRPANSTVNPAASPKLAPQQAKQTASPSSHAGLKIIVDEVLIQDVRLLIGTSKPGKLPLDFEISQVVLHKVGDGKPMQFSATLVNPKPIGNIQSSGYFGPFQQENPGMTPVWGSYFFSRADLATFKGIGGILSSTGKYQGPLNHLTVDGQATVPDFRLSSGNHPMPLHTVFHAIVDGTSGDTYLQPVDAQLAHSRFIVTGSVVRVPTAPTLVTPVRQDPMEAAKGRPHGHVITLDVTMTSARIEDFLRLAVRTDPPVMDGNLRMKARIFLPPGDVPVTDKLHLNGDFDVSGAYFSSDKIQQKINLLSRMGQGHPKDPDLHQSPPQPEPKTAAEVKGDFTLANSRMDFPDLSFGVPGAEIQMAGIYTLDGSKFDFHGHAKLHAHPSQMTTGWKSLLLKLADPLFAKQGYGTVVPIQVSGTKSEPHFGLDFGYKPPKLP
ncbi:hypothetical protein ACPOL_1663 [Acidisarcina polymorpha]|uniref:AsmA-like C-terminal domain-containing protein n=1 Tax=Acidisarcina polymorpha TaxID=2211140 RepID=A0A2Z5FVT8_9BACT|nr:hypothetical protein [Acidisarcina polymorpha]AXC11009.1 hypothetical protein ACPOL_1663 [Acidisarcina polymorpha]